MDKKIRILSILYRLMIGSRIVVSELSREYQVSSKSILRDISTIRDFLSESRDMLGNITLEYDKSKGGYVFSKQDGLQAKEVLLMLKVLAGSRSLRRESLSEILNKLVAFSCGRERELLKELGKKEIECCKPIEHEQRDIADRIWQIESTIKNRDLLRVAYEKLDGATVERDLQPISVVFSDFYFYLLACRADIENSAVIYYRVDRLKRIVRLDEKVSMDHQTRKKMEASGRYSQKMFMGEHMNMRILYRGPSVQAILDLFPTAEIVKKGLDGVEISAEVEYSRGTIMILLSQGKWVKVLSPQKILGDMKKEIAGIQKLYE